MLFKPLIGFLALRNCPKNLLKGFLLRLINNPRRRTTSSSSLTVAASNASTPWFYYAKSCNLLLISNAVFNAFLLLNVQYEAAENGIYRSFLLPQNYEKSGKGRALFLLIICWSIKSDNFFKTKAKILFNWDLLWNLHNKRTERIVP